MNVPTIDTITEMVGIMKSQNRVNLGMQKQIESLLRMNALLWCAIELLAGGNPPQRELSELTAAARGDIAELQRIHDLHPLDSDQI